MASPAAATDAARLFEEYGSRLYRFCLGRMRSREEAEDALQSTFLRVHRALAKGVAPEYEAAWLYKIAHNVCLSRRDVAGRRALVEAPRDLDEIEYALAAPEEHHDELVGLSDALAGMPANLRQAFLLRQWQGLSYAEIAEAMGTSVSAVETLIVRARRHLASALEVDGKSPAKTLAGLFDLGALRVLAGRLRNALAGAGPAKLAAGAVVVAVGGAGIGTAVGVADHAGSTRTTPVRIAGVQEKALPAVNVSVRPAARHASPRPAASHAAAVPVDDASAPATLPAEPPAAAPSSPSQTSASSSAPTATLPVPVTLAAPVSTGTVAVPPLPTVDAPPVSSLVQSPLVPPPVQAAVDTAAAPAVEPPAVPALPVVSSAG